MTRCRRYSILVFLVLIQVPLTLFAQKKLEKPMPNCAEMLLSKGTHYLLYHPIFGAIPRMYVGELDLRGADLLTDEQQSILKKYLKPEGWKLNAFLRGELTDEIDLDVIRFEVATLASLLSQLPAWQGVVFRGGYVDKDEWFSLKEGGVYSNPTFISTSKSFGTADLFPLDPEPTKIKVSFMIHSKRGRSVYFVYQNEGLEEMAGEFEVLFLPNSKFRVVNKLTYSGEHYLELEEI